MTRPTTGLSKARPFAGLRAFDLRDWKFFFGRDDQKAALYRLVDRNRFVAVIGSSGSGKSSLTRAGLFRLLQEENGERRSAPWLWCALRPGDAPIRALTDALTRLEPDKGDPDNKRDRIEHLLTGSTYGCADAVSEAGVDPDVRFVLVIDQFEELFRYSDQRQGQDAMRNARAFEEAVQFVELLLEASRSRSREIHVLITMRSDFIGECAQFSGLAEAVSATQFLVPGLTREQLEEIICRPIVDAGSTIDPDLVEQLLNDCSMELDELPVLQHCLLQLWKRAGQPSANDSEEADVGEPEETQIAAPARHITSEHYEKVGRLSGALSKHANRILRDFKEPEVAAVFRALSELRNGRAIRRALTFGHLREETGLPDDRLRPIVDRFRAEDCSFLLTSPANVEEIKDSTRIDVCHEALLRRWEKCGGTADAVATHQTGPAIGWLEQERRDGQDYQFLLSKAENRKGWLVEDIRSHLKWWSDRHPTERWAERYGGGYAAVQRMLSEGRTRRRIIQSAFGVFAIAVLAFVGNQEWRSHRAKVAADLAEAQARNIGSDVLTKALSELNHGGMQVRAALEIESSMRAIIEKGLEPVGDDGKPVEGIRLSSELYELQSKLDYTAADILYDAGNWEGTLKRANDSQGAAKILHDRAPDNVKWQGILCESTQRVGDAKELNRDYSGALAEFRRAQEIADRRGDAPASDGLCNDVDYYHSRAGDVLLKLGDPKEAQKEFELALKIAQDRAKNPDDADAQASVPRYVTKRAQALAAQEGKREQAKQEFVKAAQRQEELADGPGLNAALLSNLARTYSEEAKVVSGPAAIDLYNKAIKLHQDLVAKDTGKASWLTLLANEQHGLAEAYRNETLGLASTSDPNATMAHLSDAMAALESEHETRDKLAAIDDRNETLKKDAASVDADLASVRASYDAAKFMADSGK